MERNFTKINEAALFAGEAHASINQVRKYTQQPYIIHPMAVSRLVDEAGLSNEAVMAACLHDVVEDTPITLEEIKARFGDYVAQLVEELTDVATPLDINGNKQNRAKRTEINRNHSAQASYEGQSIKYADLIDNTLDISKNDPNFARVYLKEKRLLLEVMDKGHPSLYQKAWDTLEEAEKKIFGEVQ